MIDEDTCEPVPVVDVEEYKFIPVLVVKPEVSVDADPLPLPEEEETTSFPADEPYASELLEVDLPLAEDSFPVEPDWYQLLQWRVTSAVTVGKAPPLVKAAVGSKTKSSSHMFNCVRGQIVTVRRSVTTMVVSGP